MEIIENDKICIFTPLSSIIDAYETKRLFSEVKIEKRNIALDLKYVKDCTKDFFEELVNISKTKELGIFNIPADIFVLFNIMNIDKSVKLFVNQIDFEENSRQIINRKFSVINSI